MLARDVLQNAAPLKIVVLLCLLLSTSAWVAGNDYDSKVGSELCCNLRKVCVDQSTYVLYDPADDPRQGGRLPTCFPEYRSNHFITDLHSTSDIWALQYGTPGPVLRPATLGEESPDMQQPVFSTSTRPVVMYTHFDRIYAELMRRLMVHMYWAFTVRKMTESDTLVLSAGGTQLEDQHRWLLGPYSHLNITTLSHFSSRLPANTPEDYTVEKTHVRCFENLMACSFRHRSGRKVLSQFYASAQLILRHYQPRFKALKATIPAQLSYEDVLKVMIVTRKQSGLRNILNREQILKWCNEYKPAFVEGSKKYVSTFCMLHIPGADFVHTLALSSQMDIMVGLHGSGLYNGLFMKRRSAIIEVRPYMFGQTGWANDYLKTDLARDDNMIHWWGIDVANASRSTPGTMEVNEVGNGWKRDRNTIINIPALQVTFDRIIQTATLTENYHNFKADDQIHITDDMGAVTWKLGEKRARAKVVTKKHTKP